MWAEISEHLPDFESAVVTGVDSGGYPYSVRCRTTLDVGARTLQPEMPPDTPIRPGPASLLCHRHDEDLWNLKSFLVRGTLSPEGRGWSFRPERFIPGAGIGGPMGMVRFVVGSRRNVRRYLKRRGLARPRIPWKEYEAIKAQAFEER
jgi:hypothetical protein